MLASKKTRAQNRMYGIGTGIRSSSRNAGNADLLFDRDSRPASSESEKRTDGVHNCSIILAAWAKLVAGSRTIAVLRTMCNCTSKVRYVCWCAPDMDLSTCPQNETSAVDCPHQATGITGLQLGSMPGSSSRRGLPSVGAQRCTSQTVGANFGGYVISRCFALYQLHCATVGHA